MIFLDHLYTFLIEAGYYSVQDKILISIVTLQNLAEAEYAVALFMYMRLLGYPANRISILTTYNGQKHLIRDIINQRCGKNPVIGQPSKVSSNFIAIVIHGQSYPIQAANIDSKQPDGLEVCSVELY